MKENLNMGGKYSTADFGKFSTAIDTKIEIILDRGFFSYENLSLLKDDSYIIAASSIPKAVKNVFSSLKVSCGSPISRHFPSWDHGRSIPEGADHPW